MTKCSISSSLCILALTVLGASLLGTCMANTEVKTTQRWGWGWGWGRGHSTPPVAPPAGWGSGWGWSRGHSTPPVAPPVSWGWGWGWSRGRGHSTPPVAPPAGQGQGGWSAPGGYNFSRSGCPLSHENRTSSSGGPTLSHENRTSSSGPNKIVVGGSYNWNFGFNYSDWALKSGPYYLNDVLVFKYNAPVNGTGHSVYLLPDFQSYLKCDLTRAKQVASTNQGGGKGYEFKLNKWQPHYFACGEHNGIHCNLGMMKFFVMPIFRSWN
ncbi:hypothetical protein BVRB_9g218660 [Beta vulgaris subsp. vulgaris]|uniref:uncharacterized protein LOC104904469 n=1 Tax=Beta vulgaris subsp. vulgaris TaxID=3555 RepID=UPI00053F6CA6|nr:uncharacterized protein LOC104904469 [Beta vulgaris subsp. vulgaris]KMT00568.1 hypothetical protein BVRB_9g218660 [Beta vulgaris subsp. vulgaris]